MENIGQVTHFYLHLKGNELMPEFKSSGKFSVGTTPNSSTLIINGMTSDLEGSYYCYRGNVYMRGNPNDIEHTLKLKGKRL